MFGVESEHGSAGFELPVDGPVDQAVVDGFDPARFVVVRFAGVGGGLFAALRR